MLEPAQLPAARDFLAQRNTILRQLRAKIKNPPHSFFPDKASLGLSDRCGDNCSYCFAHAGSKGKSFMSSRLAREALLQIADASIPNLVITGGEPTNALDRIIDIACITGRARFLGLSLQTTANIDTYQRAKLFAELQWYGWDNPFRMLNFNISYDSNRPAERKEKIARFISHALGGLNNAGVIVEVSLGPPDGDASEALAFLEKEAGAIDLLYPQRKDKFGWFFSLPIMLGRAAKLRTTDFGALIRQKSRPIDFSSYRCLEQNRQTIIGVDPHGLVYPCGIFMYLGTYPIGDLSAGTAIKEMTELAQWDPVLAMISLGRGQRLYELARDIDPAFGSLLELCADPLEVVADLLSNYDNALTLLERTAKWMLEEGSKR